jgi:site-specific recombinase XerD
MAKKQTWVKMDKSSIPLAKLIEGFALYNRTTNKSPRTVDWYTERLGGFQLFVGDDATLKDISVPSARAFIAELQARKTRNPNNPFYKNKDRPLSSASIQSFARALRAFSSWLYEDGYTDTNVLRPLRPPKIQQKLVEVLSEAEIESLLAVFDRNDPYGARNYAIVFTMLDAGLRASELLDLTLTNARLQDGFLKVLGKGNKERLIPVGRRSRDALRAWLERFRSQFDPGGEEPHVFLNANGRMMTLRSLEEMLGRSGTKAGVAGLHPHRLRHTFATRFLTLGLGDTFQLQQLLGHTSLEMVRRYVSLASVQRTIVENRPSGMDRLGLNIAGHAGMRRVGRTRPQKPTAAK